MGGLMRQLPLNMLKSLLQAGKSENIELFPCF